MIDEMMLKPLVWVGSSRKDVGSFPAQVRSEMGYALFLAQAGKRHGRTKLTKGLGSGVIEILLDHRGDTFRAIYTIRFDSAVYVLHAFQKKSKSGVSTPKREIDVLTARLRNAQQIHEENRDEKSRRF